MLSIATSSSLAFAGSPVTRIAEISIVGFDKRAARDSLRQTLLAAATPLRLLRAAADRAATAIVMQQDTSLDEVVPIFSPVEDTVLLPDPSDFDPNAFVQTLPGITAPLGFFDPVGFCSSQNGAEVSAIERTQSGP